MYSREYAIPQQLISSAPMNPPFMNSSNVYGS